MALNNKWQSMFEENEELMLKVIPMQPEEAQKVLAENGYEFTMEEILEAGKELYAIRESMNKTDELSADDLDNVAGGISIATVKVICKAAGTALAAW